MHAFRIDSKVLSFTPEIWLRFNVFRDLQTFKRLLIPLFVTFLVERAIFTYFSLYTFLLSAINTSSSSPSQFSMVRLVREEKYFKLKSPFLDKAFLPRLFKIISFAIFACITFINSSSTSSYFHDWFEQKLLLSTTQWVTHSSHARPPAQIVWK